MECLPWFGPRTESPVYADKPSLFDIEMYPNPSSDPHGSQLFQRFDASGSSPKWVYIKPATPIAEIQYADARGQRSHSPYSGPRETAQDAIQSAAQQSLAAMHYAYIKSKTKVNGSVGGESSGSEGGTSPQPTPAIPIQGNTLWSDLRS